MNYYEDEMDNNVNSNVNENVNNNGNLIIIGIFIILVLLIVLLNIVKFNLVGDDKIIMIEGMEYSELGYEARTLLGRNINHKVKVSNNIDSNKVGTYYVLYNLRHLLVNKELKREVSVVKDNIDIFDIEMLGESKQYLYKGDKYVDLGVNVINKVTKEKESIKNIIGEVNNNQVGENEIRYVYEYNGEVKEVTRKVIVYGFDIKIEKEISDNKVLMNIDIQGINNFDYVLLPSGKKENNSKFSYEMSKNGLYNFIIYTKDNDIIKHEINMDINGNYECKGTVNRNGTKLEVSGNNSNNYKWIIDTKEIEGSNIYTSVKSVKEASVIVTMINGLTKEIKCDIKDELVYHFKYDENNLKPKMSCNTYTAQDKTVLDEKLKKVIEEAGYGTRAGVVEAARFLVGNLDYKVPYMGTKAENSDIGRYKKVGLNIGTGGAWGCNIGGYVQGLDCTNFVMWAFYQNGIDTHPYSHGYNDTNSVLNMLRVGDLLFTPCGNDCDPKFKYGLTHVGIIIGVDDNYFYVAEATTGSINATIVSKWDKNNMPKTGKFSQAKIFNYSSDGNLTDMWVE